jgi:hypothetical protein
MRDLEELRRQAEVALGAARLDQARGRGASRIICLLTETIEELKRPTPSADFYQPLLDALEKLGWRL